MSVTEDIVIQCSKCSHWKSETEFPPHRGGNKVTRKRQCKNCRSDAHRDWVSRNPGHWKKTRDPAAHRAASKKYWEKKGLENRYGITQKQLDAQVLFQESKCAICGILDEKLHIDHDHKTNKVRGLLCGKCNRGIGLFNDSPELLANAQRFLNEGGSWQ